MNNINLNAFEHKFIQQSYLCASGALCPAHDYMCAVCICAY